MLDNNESISENINNLNKESDGIEKLLKKLDNELEENKKKKKKQNKFVWNMNFDLDIDFDNNNPSSPNNEIEEKNNNDNMNNLNFNINNQNNINDNNDKKESFGKFNGFEDNISFKEVKINNNSNNSNLKANKNNGKFKFSLNNQEEDINKIQNENENNNKINNGNINYKNNDNNIDNNNDNNNNYNNFIINDINNNENNNNDYNMDNNNNNGINIGNNIDVNNMDNENNIQDDKKDFKKNNLIISSMNNNNNDEIEDENDIFDFDVKEIENIQKEENNKKRIKEETNKEEILKEELEKKDIEEKRKIEEEEERIKKEDLERIRKEEEERKRKEEEERNKKEEEDRIRKEEEEERIKKEEEEQRIKKEEEEQRIKKEEEERIRLENEIKKKSKENQLEQEKNQKVLDQNEQSINIEDETEEKKHNEESQIQNEEELKKETLNNKSKPEKEESNIVKKESNNLLDQNSINVEIENNSSIISDKFKHSKIFKTLPEEDKQKAISIFKEVQQFRANKKVIKNIDSYPTIIIDLNQKEKTLDNLIPDFSKRIKKETKEESEKRKKSFINHIYFEGKVETNPLLELVPDCQISHIDLLVQIFKDKGLKNIPKIDEDYEKIIFTEENSLIPEYYSPIGQLEDLKGFVFKYNIYEDTKIYINCFKNFNCWRSIQGDGNSFYRTFMFSLIEYYIINNDGNELKKLISEITSDDLILEYKQNNVDYNTAFYIYGVIIELLSKYEIIEAYDLFIKSYLLKDGSFDKILIIYLRYICFKYVDEVINLYENEKTNENSEEKMAAKSINKELIKTMNIEPNFFIICLMAYLFNVNISLFYIDRDLTQSKDGIINFIDEDNTDNIPFISIGYFYSSYFKIYTEKFINENEEIFKTKLKQLSKLTLEIKNQKKCQICKTDEYIIFLEQKFKICKKCLDKYIYNVGSLRREAFIKDNFIGLEYYSRAFNLKDNYILNDYEFIEIKEETNIINYLQHAASTMCSNCKQNFDKKNLNNLKCKCLLCDKCLEDIILKMTKGLKILNSYEKKNLKNNKCSSCGGNFIYEDAIEHLKDIKEKDNQNAIKRMENYVNTLCLICGEKVRENPEINESKISNTYDRDKDKDNIKENKKNKKSEKEIIYKEIKNYKKLKIRKEDDRGKGIDYLDIDHVICINCYEKIKSNDKTSVISKESNKYYSDLDDGECFCFICNKKHFLIDKKMKEGGCLTAGCKIY